MQPADNIVASLTRGTPIVVTHVNSLLLPIPLVPKRSTVHCLSQSIPVRARLHVVGGLVGGFVEDDGDRGHARIAKQNEHAQIHMGWREI